MIASARAAITNYTFTDSGVAPSAALSRQIPRFSNCENQIRNGHLNGLLQCELGETHV